MTSFKLVCKLQFEITQMVSVFKTLKFINFDLSNEYKMEIKTIGRTFFTSFLLNRIAKIIHVFVETVNIIYIIHWIRNVLWIFEWAFTRGWWRGFCLVDEYYTAINFLQKKVCPIEYRKMSFQSKNSFPIV